ncbi:DNA polymerase III chi subunit [hydrothermal vent metagenome]|uniref:DNA polymerase III chi subunit n=1 Tax=hydrothermal vent metagenome TaxID=652676 RepID=A0A3B0TG72_9ZZZZ
MTEILFYHLEQSPLEQVLPLLLEKTLARGWRAVVETASMERARVLDQVLWTFRDDSFLAHGIGGTEADSLQPIVLSTGQDNPNNAQVRFFVDRAAPRTDGGYQRLVYMFSGHDPDALIQARADWKILSGEHQTTYWRQEGNGRWTKKA